MGNRAAVRNVCLVEKTYHRKYGEEYRVQTEQQKIFRIIHRELFILNLCTIKEADVKVVIDRYHMNACSASNDTCMLTKAFFILLLFVMQRLTIRSNKVRKCNNIKFLQELNYLEMNDNKIDDVEETKELHKLEYPNTAYRRSY